MEGALENKDWALLKQLTNKSNINTKFGPYQKTPLHHACDQVQFDMVKWLLKSGANVNARDSIGTTPLYNASYDPYRFYGSIIELLLDFGADASISYHSYTPLYNAAMSNQPHVCARLIANYPCGVMVANVYGRTPLHTATRQGNCRVCKVLLQEGSNVNAIDCSGSTPLYEAMMYEKHFCTALLIDYGAKVEHITIINKFPHVEKRLPFALSLQERRKHHRFTALSFLQLKKRKSVMLGSGNGRDVLRIVAQFIWSERMAQTN